MRVFIPIILLVLVLTSCEVKTTPISYGKDGCAYCGMTIVDKQHASQMVTTKGKNYNFDSIECLVSYQRGNTDKEPGLLLVADYDNPGQLIDAKNAVYLKSPNITSPMAANLSAFKDRGVAEKMKEQSEGQLYPWEELSGLIQK